ncbi:MAG TPA: TolC family protein [Candidatus Binatia bacterium]|nr:TolC family protein [Candidatus Binatia bacterium]
MRRLYLLVVFAVIVRAPGAVCGDDTAALGDPLAVASLVAYARQHNPDIRAAEARWRAAQARPAQAGALPDPMINLAYHNESFDRLPLGSSEFAYARVGAEQEIPFPGKLRLKQTIATKAADAAGEAYRRTELDVISRVKIAFAEYAHLDEQLDLLRRNQALLDTIARTVESKYTVGEGVQQDVLRAQVELSLLLDRQTTLDQRRQSQTAQLNALLGRDLSEPLAPAAHPVVKSLTQALDAFLDGAHRQAPELLMAAARVAAGESGVALAYREYQPDFVVRADYFHKAALEPEWEVGIGIKIPLYFAARQRNAVAEAGATLAEASADRDTARRSVDFRVKDLYLRARASQQLIALYSNTITPQARLALTSATHAYEVGKVDFLTLLNSFTATLEYEMRYHEELANFQKAVAELEAVSGVSIEE